MNLTALRPTAIRVFDPFVRLSGEDTGSGAVDRAGLGLSIALRMCEDAGGKLWAESTLGLAPKGPTAHARTCNHNTNNLLLIV